MKILCLALLICLLLSACITPETLGVPSGDDPSEASYKVTLSTHVGEYGKLTTATTYCETTYQKEGQTILVYANGDEFVVPSTWSVAIEGLNK